MRASWPALLFLLGAAGCGSDTNRQNYAEAAALTSLQIVAVGVNRAVTGDCWAHCSPGYLCNRESGLCERGECMPACEIGWHCTRNAAGGLYCARDSDGAGTQSTLNTTPLPPAPFVVDAGIDATTAQGSGSADAETDAAPALP